MAKLHLYFLKHDNQTFTKFDKKKDSDKVFFYNLDGVDTLAVTIKSQPGFGDALCDGNTPVTSFNVPRAGEQKYKICSGYDGDWFKYTAKIGTSTAEDPIIIISRSAIIPPELVFTAVAIVLVAVGILIGMRLARRRSVP